MNRFKPFSEREKFTLAMALVNSSICITKAVREYSTPAMSIYAETCVNDNDDLLAEVNEAIEDGEETQLE